MPEQSKPGLLMVSNYLASPRHNKNIWHSLSERLRQVGYEVLTTSSRENQLLRLLDMLWTAWARRNDYDLAQIDVFSGKAFIFAEACAGLLKCLRKPILLTLHGGGLPQFSRSHPRRVRRLLRSASLVVTPSPFLMNGFAQFRSDIRMIPNPINLDATKFRQRDHLKPKLIWVRAFHKVYNPTLAVKVTAGLRDRYPEVHLTMIGPDKGDGSLAEVMETAHRLGVTDHLTIIQGVPHDAIFSYLDQADIFINTTNYDTSPRSMVEAMANGLCVVSTDVGGIPYLAANQVEALLVPPGDEPKMIEAVELLLSDPHLAGQLSYQARKKAEQYDWPEILDNWEQLFLALGESSRG